MNKEREHMNVKVIDKSTKENDQSHQNVDNNTGQGANISLFLNKNRFADTFDSEGSSISMFTENGILDRVVTRRKENEINEGNKIIASDLKYNPINDQMDIMNKR